LSGSSGGDSDDAAAHAAACETVAPLRQLVRAAEDAVELMRYARVLELRERALALADDASSQLPHDSLVVAELLKLAYSARVTQHCDAQRALDGEESSQQKSAALEAAWCNDEERTLALSRRCLLLLNARWRAGTLFALTPEERAFFADEPDAELLCGAELYVYVGSDASVHWPPSQRRGTPAREEEHLRAMHGMLLAAHEMLRRCAIADRDVSFESVTFFSLAHDLQLCLSAAPGGLLPKLRSICGLTQADEARLRQMQPVVGQLARAREARFVQRARADLTAQCERGAADIARHGLRACALPDCAQTELRPKTFKVCGRCKAAAYCCAAHQQQDWRRHKRADGCMQQQQA
jgi:hypothetical protein